jgi:hypothetical protein
MITELDSHGCWLAEQGVRCAPVVQDVDFPHGRPGWGAVTAAGYGFVCRTWGVF